MAGNNFLTRLIFEAEDRASGVITKIGAALATYFAVDKISGFFGSAVKGAADLEKQFSTLQAATGATTEDIARLQAKAEELGASDKLAVSAVQAAEAMTELGRAGQSSAQILESITPVMALAQGAALELGEAAGIVAANLAGFQLSADQSGRVADVLSTAASSAKTTVKELADALSYAAPAANAAGMSIEETTAIIAKMQNAGIDGSRAGTALNAMLASLADPASTASKALDVAGISTRVFSEVLAELEKGGPAAKAAIVGFGTEAGPALQALLAQGSASVRKLQSDLDGAGGSAEKAAATMNDNLAGAFEAVSSVWEGLKTSLGQPLLEPLTVQVRALSTSLGEFASSSSFEAIKNGLVGTFNAASSAAAALGRNIGSIAVVAAGASFSALLSVVVKSTAAMAAYAASVAAARDAQLQQTLAERNASIAAAESAAANARVTASHAQRAAAANTQAQAELAAAQAAVATARADLAAASGSSARIAAIQALRAALITQTAAQQSATTAAAAYTASQITATQAAAAAAAAANAGTASMTLMARAAAGLKSALTLLLSPLAMIGGLVSGIVGYKFGEWLRESAAEARGSASAMGLLDSALRTFDDGLKSLSGAYRGQTEAEEALAEKRRKGAEILSLVERQTGLTFDSIQALGDAVDKGAVIFDRASGTWRKGAVSMEDAANAATNLDAALQAQAKAIADVAERESAAEAIARTRRESAIELAKAYGDEAEALKLTAEAREADAAQSQRLVEIRAGELANAQERLAAMIAEAEASKEGVGVKQTEIGALTNLVEIKSKALVEAQMAAEATEQEANVARLATDTYGDQSARVAELTEKRDALNTKLRASVAAQEAGAEAQKQLAEAEKVVLGIAGEYIQAVQDGSPAVRDLAAAHAEAQAKVDALKAAIEAGKTAADGDKQAKEELRQATAALADALDDLVQKREFELQAAERNTSAIEAEGDLRVTHLRNLASEAEARGNVTLAARLNQEAAEAEARTLAETAKAKLAEVEAAEAVLEAKRAEIAASGDQSLAAQKTIADAEAAVAAKEREAAAYTEAARVAAEAADTVSQRLRAQYELQQQLSEQSLTSFAGLQNLIGGLSTGATEASTALKQYEDGLEIVTAAEQAMQDAYAASDSAAFQAAKSAKDAAEQQIYLAERTLSAGNAAVAMMKLLQAEIDSVRQYSVEAAAALDTIFFETLDTWQSKIAEVNELNAADFINVDSIDQARAQVAELDAAAEAAALAADRLITSFDRSFINMGPFYDGLGAIEQFKSELLESQAAALRTEIAIEEMGEALDGITDSYDQGELSLSQYIAKLEQLRHEYSALADEDLADVEDALADAKAEQEDLVETAVDGLQSWREKLLGIYDQEVAIQQLNWQQDRLETEIALAEARRNGNAEEIAALEQQLSLIDEYYQYQVDLAALQEAQNAIDEAEDAADEAERLASLSEEERAYEATLEALKKQLAAAIKAGDEALKQSIIDQIAAEKRRHETVMANLEDETSAKTASANTGVFGAATSGASTQTTTTQTTETTRVTETTSASKTIKLVFDGATFWSDESNLDALLEALERVGLRSI